MALQVKPIKMNKNSKKSAVLQKPIMQDMKKSFWLKTLYWIELIDDAHVVVSEE